MIHFHSLCQADRTGDLKAIPQHDCTLLQTPVQMHSVGVAFPLFHVCHTNPRNKVNEHTCRGDTCMTLRRRRQLWRQGRGVARWHTVGTPLLCPGGGLGCAALRIGHQAWHDLPACHQDSPPRTSPHAPLLPPAKSPWLRCV